MSFLNSFMAWNEGTEVAENYYYFSGLSAIAACVNGQIWIRQGKFVHYPNLYVVLLGPPGNGKTVAIDRAEEVVRDIGDIQLSGQSETSEGLLRFLRDQCIRTIELEGQQVPYTPISLYLSELSNFLGKDPAGMIDMLTGIWDRGGRQYFRRTKGAGEDMLPRPNVNLLAGTTPEWITQYLKADIVGGGFTRRVVFVNEARRSATNRVAWPEDSPQQMEAKANCVKYGQILRTLKGEVQYSPEAKLEYIRWYDTRPEPKSREEEGYFASKPAIMLKMACLLALSREPRLLITKDDIEVSLALLTKSEVNRDRVFQAIGRNELNAIATRVLDFLHNSPYIEYIDNGRHLRARFAFDKAFRGAFYREAQTRELDEILTHLLSTGKIFYYSATRNNASVTYIGLKDSIEVLSREGTTPKG